MNFSALSNWTCGGSRIETFPNQGFVPPGWRPVLDWYVELGPAILGDRWSEDILDHELPQRRRRELTRAVSRRRLELAGLAPDDDDGVNSLTVACHDSHAIARAEAGAPQLSEDGEREIPELTEAELRSIEERLCEDPSSACAKHRLQLALLEHVRALAFAEPTICGLLPSGYVTWFLPEWGQAGAIDCLRTGLMPVRDVETGNIGLVRLLVKAADSRPRSVPGAKRGGTERRGQVIDALIEMMPQTVVKRGWRRQTAKALLGRFPEYTSIAAFEKIVREQYPDDEAAKRISSNRD